MTLPIPHDEHSPTLHGAAFELYDHLRLLHAVGAHEIQTLPLCDKVDLHRRLHQDMKLP